jgi:hypothetical protein
VEDSVSPRELTLGFLADAVAVLEEALEHGYSPEAAWSAAFEHLVLADLDELRQIAATMATLAVLDLTPRGGMSMRLWVEARTARLASLLSRPAGSS